MRRKSGGDDGSTAKPLLAFAATFVVWLVAAGGPGDESMARWVGMLGFHLVAAALIRWLYTRPQRPRPPLASPVLFLIAAAIALLGRFGQPT